MAVIGRRMSANRLRLDGYDKLFNTTPTHLTADFRSSGSEFGAGIRVLVTTKFKASFFFSHFL